MSFLMEDRRPIPRRPAVFLDKDGTLVVDVPYNVDPERVRLTTHAIEGLQLLQECGYALFIVTNQAGMAKGFFSHKDWQAMQAYLSRLLASHGICISGFRVCPHHPQGTVAGLAIPCACRKPLPGMLLQAASEHGIDLQHSWMIGDILHDIEAGKRAGCRTVLIENGNETEWQINANRIPELVASDLLEAAHAILASDRNSAWHDRSILGADNSIHQ
jgi:D-glycero-D-manno-heptose 1,7-bisphosphate phosphatase